MKKLAALLLASALVLVLERHDHEAAALDTGAVNAALARAKERAPATYEAMDQALAKASGRAPGAYKAMRKAKPKAPAVSAGE